MNRAVLVLLFLTVPTLGDGNLEQRLAKRSLFVRHPPSGHTLSQALAALSADYQAHYHEPLRIYIAAELAQPSSARKSLGPPQRISGLEPLPGRHSAVLPATPQIDSGPLRVPVLDALRYITTLADVDYTLLDGIVLIHPKVK